MKFKCLFQNLIIIKSYKTERFFTITQFNFAVDNILEMVDVAGKAADHAEFPFDIRTIQWEEYFLRMTIGTQKFILKSGEEERPRARQILKL